MARKEKLMKVLNNQTLDETSKLNGILIDCIKTKLDMLNELKDDD